MHWKLFLQDPVLAAFEGHEAHGTRVLIRREYLGSVERLGVGGHPAHAVRMVGGGRQPHPLVEIPGCGEVMVRQYLRGGAVRHVNRARYFGGHRAFEELRTTEKARSAGVNVPLTIAAAEQPRRVGYTAWLATRWIPDARDLHGWLLDHGVAAGFRALHAAGHEIGKLHRAGIAHPDLNLRNLLVTPSPDGNPPSLYVLDFDRAELFDGPVPARRRARNLLRLGRSARKLGSGIDAAGWDAFRAGYGADWPLRSLPE